MGQNKYTVPVPMLQCTWVWKIGRCKSWLGWEARNGGAEGVQWQVCGQYFVLLISGRVQLQYAVTRNSRVFRRSAHSGHDHFNTIRQ